MPSQQDSLLGAYLQPGTRIKVGQYSTKIVRYLSEGGFSHVYIAKLDIPVKGSDVAVLKRIVAPDKFELAAIRTEVETMKRLKGHRHIVTYIDSHASALKIGFEVYVLMEYCPGGGLIDFMNTRLQTRLAEWEVLKIFSDTAEAVACMHYLKPPLLHRDLKIENVLMTSDGCYKLCDFGSCTEPRPPATNTQERRALEEDIQKHTTIQYRSPEMVDVSRKLPIDEKSDIWALGVLLYKLCYFTTPFEAQGQLAILNAAYTFPPFPPYTDRTKRLIAVTLQEDPRDRPNIYQLVAEICAMRNVPVPIEDIYRRRSTSSHGTRSRPSSRPPSKADNVLRYEEAVPAEPMKKPAEISPMRRGRPEKSGLPAKPKSVNEIETIKLSRQIISTPAISAGAQDEFSAKFPSLEDMDFALTAGTGKYDFPNIVNESLMESEATAHIPKPSEVVRSGAYLRSDVDSIPQVDPVDKDRISRDKPGKPLSQFRPILKPKADELPKEDQKPSQTRPSLPPKSVKTDRNNFPSAKTAQQRSEKTSDRPVLTQANREPNRQIHHIDSSMDFLKELDSSVASTASDSIDLGGDVLISNERGLPSDLTRPVTTLRRSVSVNSSSAKHSKRPSLSNIPSFSDAAKTIMSGKFGDAFRKFETKKVPQQERFRPLKVEEADLPARVTQHIKTTEARRSLSYSKLSKDAENSNEGAEDTSTPSVKEAMRLLREKATQEYVPQRSAQGYGKYTDSGLQRASTIIPIARPLTSEKPSSLTRPQHAKNQRRYALPVDDEDFTKRYPSVSDFRV